MPVNTIFNILGKEKMLVISIFSFSHNIFYCTKETVFPVKFQLKGIVSFTTEKWGYKEKNRGTKQN